MEKCCDLPSSEKLDLGVIRSRSCSILTAHSLFVTDRGYATGRLIRKGTFPNKVAV